MIYIIGIASSGRSSLTDKALGVIKRARLLVGAKRHLAEFDDFEGERVVLGSGGVKTGAALDVIDKASGTTVLFATGDPTSFGIGELACKRFGMKRVTILPNLSIVTEAFGRIKKSQNGVKIVSLHGAGTRSGRSPCEGLRDIPGQEKVAVYTDKTNTPKRICSELLSLGISGYTAYVFEALGTGEEKITRGSLSTIASKSFNPLNLLVLIKKQGGITGPGAARSVAGIVDSEFHHRSGMITKAEIRVVALSKLALAKGSVFWDVGSGSGSVAIDAALSTDALSVYAIEKNRERLASIEKNIKKFGAAKINVIKGAAPASLKGLPSPDAVFVGGGGLDVSSILSCVKRRARPGARVVVSAVTLETLGAATKALGSGKWSCEVVSLALSRSRGLCLAKRGKELTMMKAENPVYLITGTKKQE